MDLQCKCCFIACFVFEEPCTTCTCVPILLTEILYPLQDGYTPLHLAARGGHTMCVEHILSTPGIDVNIKDKVSWSIEYNTDAYIPY